MPKTELAEPLEMDVTLDTLLEDDDPETETEVVETKKRATKSAPKRATKEVKQTETEDIKEFLVIVQRAMMEQTNLLTKIALLLENKETVSYEVVVDAAVKKPVITKEQEALKDEILAKHKNATKKEEPVKATEVVKYERITKELDRILKGILPNDPNGVDILPDGRQRVAEVVKKYGVKSFKDLKEKDYASVLKQLKAIK